MKFGRSFLLGACALGFLLPSQAMAATFMMRFSGAAFNNTAIAEGSFTIDDAELAAINSPSGSSPPYTAISNLTLTVTGAASGNGVFTDADFFNIAFFTQSTLDLTRELVGQAEPGGRTFGQLNTSGSAGDFNLFADGQGKPNGVNYFTLEANGNGGNARNQMALVSLAPAVSAAVPEPATWATMMLGFGGLGFAMRRKPKVSARVRFA